MEEFLCFDFILKLYRINKKFDLKNFDMILRFPKKVQIEAILMNCFLKNMLRYVLRMGFLLKKVNYMRNIKSGQKGIVVAH